MEVVVAEAPAEGNWEHFIPQVEVRAGRIVAALHWGWYRKEPVSSSSRQLLLRRKIYLLKIVQEALDSSATVAGAVETAFDKMNRLLEPLVDIENAKEGFWRVQNTSVVFVVQQGHVHVFGRVPGVALLCRHNEDKHLLPRLPHSFNEAGELRNTLSKFGYYHKERLTEKDEYLVVGAAHICRHTVGDFAHILRTRIQAFGLAEACKQIAGRFLDLSSRTFVCIPLEESLKDPEGAVDEPEPAEDWVIIGPESKSDNEAAEDMWKDDDDESADEMDIDEGECWAIRKPVPPTPRTHLFPLIDNQPQEPPPLTACWNSGVRDACIRKFNFASYENPAMVCEYNSCSIFITKGDISKWSVDGEGDLIVHVEGLSDIHKTTTSQVASKVLHVKRPRRFMLATAYRRLLSLAVERGVKNLAIPALFSTNVRFPISHSNVEEVYEEASEIIRAVIENVGTVGMWKVKKDEQQRIQVHFVSSCSEVWRALVAATDQLAHWDPVDATRWYNVQAEKELLNKPKRVARVVEDFPPLPARKVPISSVGAQEFCGFSIVPKKPWKAEHSEVTSASDSPPFKVWKAETPSASANPPPKPFTSVAETEKLPKQGIQASG